MSWSSGYQVCDDALRLMQQAEVGTGARRHVDSGVGRMHHSFLLY